MDRLITLVLVLTCCACATTQQNPARHPANTGEVLAVEEDEKRIKTIERENLVNFNSSSLGRSASSALGFNIGRDVEREHVVRSFLLTHGGMPVDEQDFYELAGDLDAARQIEETRRELVARQEFWATAAPLVGGVGCVGGGCITAVGTLAFASLVFSLVGIVVMPVGLVIMGGGPLIGVLGWSAASAAKSALIHPAYLLPVERARAAAAAHNAKRRQPAVAAVEPSSLRLEDPTGCINEAALRRDVDAIAADGGMKLVVAVEARGGATRLIHLHIERAGAASTRDLEVDVAECGDVPRLVSRVVRAQGAGR